MAWIDYKKAYNLVPYSWSNECMEMFGIIEDVRNFLGRNMEHWNLSVTSNGDVLGMVDVKRDISRGQPFAIFICAEYDTCVNHR